MTQIAVYTVAGSAQHCELCDAFLGRDGYTLIAMDRLYQVVSMETAADRERTLWRLVAASHAGTA